MAAAEYKLAAAADGVCGLWFRKLSLQLKRKVPLLDWEWLTVSMAAAKYKLAAEADRRCVCNWKQKVPLLGWEWLTMGLPTA